MRRTSITSRSGSIFLTVFALPFLGVGLFMGFLMVKSLVDQQQMASWDEVPATLIDVHMEVDSGGDSTSYKVTAQYHYEYKGRNYRGDRVGIHSSSDNLGKYHQRMSRRLKKAMNAGHTVPAYVNPKKPSHSVLDRKVRIEKIGFSALFLLVFGGAGGVMLFFSIKGKGLQKIADDLEAEYPDEPWKWNPDWAKREIPSESKSTMWFAIGFALFWNLVSCPLLFIIPDEVKKGNPLA